MPTESKKRVFGSDITNINFERNRVEFLGQKAKQLKQQVKSENAECEFYPIHSEQNKKPRSYQYGPFAPATVAKIGSGEQKHSKPAHELESLALTHRPQYHNQGTMLILGLFGLA